MSIRPPFAPPRILSSGIPRRFGRYLLERRIAVGGSSEVYLARPAEGTWPAPQLVIKRLIPSFLENPQSVGTFAMEARLHRAAQHPNVVEVFEAGSVEGEPFLAMEYVDGVDAYQLLRRCQTERRPLPAEVAIFMASEVCLALACVHTAVDDSGHPLAVVHRDVTPSNVYLSDTGHVKLGDFGIARLLSAEPTLNTHPLKGKYAYLSPEQVAGEDFDHRADLFSLTVMLSEFLINQSLFPGSGQLAVLLAIRDGRIDALHENVKMLPHGLMPVLEHGLARNPKDRFRSAEQLRQALEPFVMSEASWYRKALGRSVVWARDKGDAFRSIKPIETHTVLFDESQSVSPLATVRTSDGQVLGPYLFAKLVELIATSRLDRMDEVDLHGLGFERIIDIPELERHVPPSTATTNQLTEPSIPDYRASLSSISMLNVFGLMLRNRETGVLFAERARPQGLSIRKEIYLSQAKIIHVASTEQSELFGEYLVRRGLIEREELDLALAVLPRYDGRLGDTLIALGLADAVQIFRAIRDQGRDRITEIFTWAEGNITFYRNVSPSRVEFPLDLDLAPLMSAGLRMAASDEQLLTRHRDSANDLLVAVGEVPDTMRLAAWPPEVLKVVGAAGHGRSQGDILGALTAARLIDVPDALRAIDIACASGLLDRVTDHRRA